MSTFLSHPRQDSSVIRRPERPHTPPIPYLTSPFNHCAAPPAPLSFSGGPLVLTDSGWKQPDDFARFIHLFQYRRPHGRQPVAIRTAVRATLNRPEIQRWAWWATTHHRKASLEANFRFRLWKHSGDTPHPLTDNALSVSRLLKFVHTTKAMESVTSTFASMGFWRRAALRRDFAYESRKQANGSV